MKALRLLIVVALALLAAPKPLLSAATMACCARPAKTAWSHCHGERTPVKSGDSDSCCIVCAVALAILASPPAVMAQPPDQRAGFAAPVVGDVARADSPPVPPPRV